MIIAWVLCIILMVSGLVNQLGHSAALQIRLLAIEQGSHVAFVAAENRLNQCEAQLSNAAPLAVLNVQDTGAACEVTIVDANAKGELIRIRARGSAKQTALESMVYRNKQDQGVERLSWRVLWSADQSVRSSAL